MTARVLSAKERRQRAAAALKSGAFSVVKVSDLRDVFYGRALWRLENEQGATSAKQRLILKDIAFYDAQIALADAWLDEQRDPLFKDRRSGELWPLIDRRDGWVRARAALNDKMPEGGAR